MTVIEIIRTAGTLRNGVGDLLTAVQQSKSDIRQQWHETGRRPADFDAHISRLTKVFGEFLGGMTDALERLEEDV